MLYDCHAHSLHSHDAASSVGEICHAAVNVGLFGIAVTDHCDCEFAVEAHAAERVAASVRDTKNAAAAFSDRLTVMCGVELGDALFDPAFAKKIATGFPFDLILGSVHAVRSDKNSLPFSGIDFSLWSQPQLDEYLRQYFADVRETLLSFDFDVLCHLTVPFRYINEKYNRCIDPMRYFEEIREILRLTVSTGKTLEINTQGVSPAGTRLHPNEAVIDLFLSLGGRDFCLGSDAHTPEGVGNGAWEGACLLRKKGIRELIYFKDREKMRYAF